jgi:putative acetyltransferase
MSTHTIRDARPGDESSVRQVVASVLAEYGLALDPDGVDADLRDVSDSYQRPGGTFRVVVDEGGAVVGCVGLRPLGDGDIELRKMYLLPRARGLGLGRRLLDEMIGFGQTHGFRRIVLETLSVLRDAIALYERAGFVEVAGHHVTARCDRTFAMELGRVTTAREA